MENRRNKTRQERFHIIPRLSLLSSSVIIGILFFSDLVNATVSYKDHSGLIRSNTWNVVFRFTTQGLNGLAFVNNYCIGKNGILMTGYQASSSNCCQYNATIAEAGVGGNSAVKGKPIYIAVKGLATRPTLNSIVKNIQGTYITDASASQVACPGDLTGVFEDLFTMAADTDTTIDNTIANINSLRSEAPALTTLQKRFGTNVITQNNAGLNPYGTGNALSVGAATAGFTTDASAQQPSTLKAAAIPPQTEGGLSNLANRLLGSSGTSSGGGSGAVGTGAGQSQNLATSPGSLSLETPSQHQGSLYSSGGSGGGGGGSGGGSSNNEVDPAHLSWGLGNANRGVASGSGSDGGSMGQKVETEDPTNYFDRTQRNDNLFKKVEEKYREKAPQFPVQ